MKHTILTTFLSLTLCLYLSAQRSTILFDDDWRFFRGNAQSADEPAFDDSQWRKVQLPHDWSIEDIPGTSSPFQLGAVSQVSGGFTAGGMGWYRKSFVIPRSQKGKRFYIQFDGVYMNAVVYINGKRLGRHPYGYTSFWYDITDRLKFDTTNVLAVSVTNEGMNSRWYSGSGIYRHVRLTTVESLHIAPWGVSISTPQVTANAATIEVHTKLNVFTNPLSSIRDTSAIVVKTSILNPSGVEVAKVETKTSSLVADQKIIVQKPHLWSLENPNLHTAVVTIYRYGVVTDETKTSFGIRSISFTAQNGFQLNGKTVKLKGGCVHHDNGPLGARAYDRAEERRVQLLKASGYNAIRCAHNPPSPAFLDACDRLGMLVIDEAFDMWNEQKNPFDYHLYFNEWWKKDIESMVQRDRNHPSVIMWSTGNEIPNRATPEVAVMSKKITDYVHSLDSTRPVTTGINGVAENEDPLFATIDVGGYNYAYHLYEQDHNRVPNRVIYGSESFAMKAFENWQAVEKYPWVVGDFVWTAFDYIGEASIGWLGYPQTQKFYPWNLAYCGDIDICGWKRPQSYYRDAVWKKNALSLFVRPLKPTFDTNANRAAWSEWHWYDDVASWNWEGDEGKILPVVVYSSCDEVELFLNSKSLGRRKTDTTNKYTAQWNVAYQPGELKAVGYSNKKKVNEALLQTAGNPSRIKLTADRTTINADGQDLSYITVELTDDKGVRHTKAEDLIQFEIEGPATIIGVGNAKPNSLESYQQPQRTAWQGRCLVIVKAEKKAGAIILKAKAANRQPAQITITSSN
jgi:beta-galactosidase